jgi:hypothetical protein
MIVHRRVVLIGATIALLTSVSASATNQVVSAEFKLGGRPITHAAPVDWRDIVGLSLHDVSARIGVSDIGEVATHTEAYFAVSEPTANFSGTISEMPMPPITDKPNDDFSLWANNGQRDVVAALAANLGSVTALPMPSDDVAASGGQGTDFSFMEVGASPPAISFSGAGAPSMAGMDLLSMSVPGLATLGLLGLVVPAVISIYRRK